MTDANGDGKQDLVVLQTNGAWPTDTHPSHPASLYLNTGNATADYANPTGAKTLAGFTEKPNSGITGGNEMSAFTSFDIDNDGDLDLLNGSSDWPSASVPHIYINDGTGTYTQKDSPILHGSYYHHGATIFDADLDGDQDAVWTSLHVFKDVYPRMWENGATYLKATANGTVDPAKAFYDATTDWGVTAKISGSGNMGSAGYTADLDGDGDLDFVTNLWSNTTTFKVYRNDSNLRQANWLKVELIGAVSPAQGTGARVEVELKDATAKKPAQIVAKSTYQFIPGQFTWAEAKADAESKGGYLATITSQAENSEIKAQLGADYNKDLFIGAYSANGDGKWQWVSGEAFIFSIWDSGSYRQSVDIQWPAPHISHKWANKETWDDAGDGFNNLDGYILEKPVSATATTKLAQYLGYDSGAATLGSLTFGLADKTQAAKVTVYWPSGLKSVLENVDGNRTIQIREADELPLPRPTDEGDVIAWGANPNGETTVPTTLGKAVQIAAGDSSSAALLANGAVSVWGTKWAAQRNVPATLGNVVQIAAGNNHYLALTANGSVVAWGWNTTNQTVVPTTIKRAKFIAAGFNSSYAITGDGRIVAWGANDVGQLNVPAGLSGITTLSAGRGHVLALKSNGTVVAWGRNDLGQATVPAGLTNVIQIAAGDYHSLALKSDGTVVAWGANWISQATVPAGLGNVVQISAKGDRSLALKADNSVVSWGLNADNIAPPPAPGTMLGISAGSKHSLGLVRKIQIALTGDLPVLKENQPLSDFGFTATGGSGNYTWSVVGTKPDWLTLNATTGLLSGTPTTAGNQTVTVRVSSGGRWSDIALTFEIQKAIPTALWVATTGNNTTGDGSLSKPFATITKAHALANRGDVIKVLPGNYTESVVIEKSLEISSTAGPAKTTIRSAGLASAVYSKGAGVKGGKLIGFTLTGGGGANNSGNNRYGGGFAINSPAGTTYEVKNCIISDNNNPGITFGGGLHATGGTTLNLTNSLIKNNAAWASGGAALIEGANLIADRCTIVSNTNNGFNRIGGISGAGNCNIQIKNSILWNNTTNQYASFSSGPGGNATFTFSYSDIQGGTAATIDGNTKNLVVVGPGNINSDPKFAETTNYTLGTGSPAINTGDLNAAKDADGSRADIGWDSAAASSNSGDPNLVIIQGGTLLQSSALAGQSVSAFQIGRSETTWGEWKSVRTWAVANGYSDLATVGNGTADNHPVKMINWYDAVKWCNAKSEMDGLTPVYQISGATYKTGQSLATANSTANGYRLPHRAEWDWAARGGVSGIGYAFSGSNNADLVGWYSANAGGNTKPIGLKAPNELGLYDMTGNVWEWCSENEGAKAYYSGGSWFNDLEYAELSYTAFDAPTSRYPDYGFRLARNIGPKISISGTIPEPTLNQAYAGYTFTAVGATGAPVWFVSSGSLPPGMSFNATTATLSGTPTTAGNYTVTIKVASGGYSDEKQVVFDVKKLLLSSVATSFTTTLQPGIWHGFILGPSSENFAYIPKITPKASVTQGGLIDKFVVQPEYDGVKWNDVLRIIASPLNPSFEVDVRVFKIGEFASVPAASALSKVVLHRDFGSIFQPSDWRGFILDETSNKVAYVPKITPRPNATDGAYIERTVVQSEFNGTNWYDVLRIDTADTGYSFEADLRVFKIKPSNELSQGEEIANVSISGQFQTTLQPGVWHGFILGPTSKDVSYIPEITPVSTNAIGGAFVEKYTVQSEFNGTNWYDVLRMVIPLNQASTPVHVRIYKLVAKQYQDMVTVQGGTLPQSSGLAGQSVQAFQIGKYEVTWGEWKTVRTWAVANGYTDLANVGAGSGDDHPVQQVSWYDVVKWSNAKSEMEGLTPVYTVSGATCKTSQSVPTVNTSANGYRLPVEKEWDWAARGGGSSQGYAYSGSNDVNAVAWYGSYYGGVTQSVGTKGANELGIYDMSGNVWEWCWDLDIPPYSPRRLRGGSWNYDANHCTVALRFNNSIPSFFNIDIGFRLARNIGPKISISGTMPEPTLNQAYAGYTFTASGVTGTPAWSVSSGSLPPGMSFNATTATLSGTPATAGNYTFTIKVASGGYSDEVEVDFEIAAPQVNYAAMVLVQGGTLPAGSALSNQTVSAFHIACFETSRSEWTLVVDWAQKNGYDLSLRKTDFLSHPIQNVKWYDAIKWCNAKSEMEGLAPVYLASGNVYRSGMIIPEVQISANGYRLPNEIEWEWAARGGQMGGNFTYSGSNAINDVGWYNQNAINPEFVFHQAYTTGIRPVGIKLSNQLGINDMSGNVGEWCWEAVGSYRRVRGGWFSSSAEQCAVNWRGDGYPDGSQSIENIRFRYARNAIGDMLTVQGGTLPAGSGLAGQVVQTFDIGRFEITWEEWQTVRTYAIANGYDLTGVGNGTASTRPVQRVNWYDAVKWCNAKSHLEGLTPVYTVNGTVFKAGQVDPTQNTSANGYRLPSEKEWEWAARGGGSSQGYTYSGSNDMNSVMWYNGNSSGVAKTVGTKVANELGIFDMSGNMWEWCGDLFTTSSRRIRGGTFDDLFIDGAVSHRGYGGFMVNRYGNYGFRLARSY